MKILLSNILNPLTTKKAVIIIAIVGILVYCNALFNGFVWDDIAFIFNDPDIRNFNIVHLFGNSIYTEAGFYRPIHALYNALLYALFSSHAFFYHFLQISLHILSAVLVYFLLRYLLSRKNAKDIPDNEWQRLSGSQRVKYLRKYGHPPEMKANIPDVQSNILSLFLSLVFLVHPINVESVAYIAAFQSELFFLFGIAALLASMKEKVAMKVLFFVSAFLLLSLLAKETGILFLLMIFCFQFLFNRKRKPQLFLFGLATLGIYFFLRFAIGGVFFAKTIAANAIPIDKLTFVERLVSIPAIVFYYLYTTIFPLQLAVSQKWIITKLTAQEFYLPLFLDSIFFIVLCIGGVYIYMRRRSYFNAFLFFFVWFLSGLLMLVQIFPLEMTVADRWFYFPLVGILGMLGVGIQTLLYPNKQDVSLVKHEKVAIAAAWLGTVLILLLSLRTMVRNANYHDEITLYTHDSQIQDNYGMEGDLGADYAKAGNLQAALPHFQKSVNLNPIPASLFNLGHVYELEGNKQKAAEYYSKALIAADAYYPAGEAHDPFDKTIYTQLAQLYLISTSNYVAPEFITRKGLQYFPDTAVLWAELALCEYKLQKQNETLFAAMKAKTLAPNEVNNFFYTLIVHKQEIPTILVPMIIAQKSPVPIDQINWK